MPDFAWLGDMHSQGEMVEIGLDFGQSHLRRVSFVVKQDGMTDPSDLGVFYGVGRMLAVQGCVYLVEQFGWIGR